jgi:hypothetical protein
VPILLQKSTIKAAKLTLHVRNGSHHPLFAERWRLIGIEAGRATHYVAAYRHDALTA